MTGGARGTGVFAVQLAKALGAYVIATGSPAKSKQILTDLGVDGFIDYKQVELEEGVRDVDVIPDCVGGKVIDQCF